MPKKSLYAVHPTVAYARTVLENIPDKTGKSVDQWVRLIKKDGPAERRARIAWLKTEHQIGLTSASLLIDRADGTGKEIVDDTAYLKAAADHVEAMYSGPRAALRPLHDALFTLCNDLGKDVGISPCATIVPVYRTHVIAQIKPTTQTRIDFGLALKGAKRKPPKRLEPTGGLEKGNRITHQFRLTSLEQIDDQVRDWARVAYELDA